MRINNHFVILFLGIACSAIADPVCTVVPNFIPRSQGRDATRQMVSTVGHTHLYMDSWYAMLSVMPEYTQSFNPSKLADCLFGFDAIDICDRRTILVQGSQVANRDPRAWLADYLYLQPDYNGSFSVAPVIKNFLIDLDLYVGLDYWVCGLYARLYGPFVHTMWNLDFCEQVGTGTAPLQAGYFTVNELPATNVLQSVTSYMSGNAPGNGSITQQADKDGNQIDFVTKFGRLAFARMSNGTRVFTGFAEFRFELGYNLMCDDCAHIGFNLQGAIPACAPKKASYFFDAYVGNGNHWELGAGMTGHYIFWRNEPAERQFGFFFDANITHLFNATEQRSFDLSSRPNSRYMLAQRFKTPLTDDLQNGAGIAPSAQFAAEYTPVANLTTFNVDVSVNMQTDIVAMFNIVSCGWSFDVGYNFWARGCETIQRPTICKKRYGCGTPSLCDASQERIWALKGDARVYGFTDENATNAGEPIALSATQTNATMHNGTNAITPAPGNDTFYHRNFGVDNPAFATVGTTILDYAPGLSSDPDNQIKTSINPLFLSCDDIDFCQGMRGLSNKVFINASYIWDKESWIPYFGAGAFAEFGAVRECDQDTMCRCPQSFDSRLCSLSQWGFWLKAGVSFE